MQAEINEFTGGRARCFVIGRINKRSAFEKTYQAIKRKLEEDGTISCFRADEFKSSGRDLLSKIHRMIEHADVVIADLSHQSVNIFYEYGYAMAHLRTPIVICRRGSKLPIDVKGLEIIRYSTPVEKDGKGFLRRVKEAVTARLSSTVPALRRAFPVENPFPAFIISALRAPTDSSRPAHPWHGNGTERNSYAENCGISGILGGYGLLFGVDRRPELIHADYAAQLEGEDANLFLLGSPKVNRLTGQFLAEIQTGLWPRWSMRRVEKEEVPDPRYIIEGTGYTELNRRLARGISKRAKGRYTDYGLVVRAPRPQFEDRLVTIMAGRHSVGTHAACLLLTEPVLIERLGAELDKCRIPRRVRGGKAATGAKKRQSGARDGSEELSILSRKEIPFWAIVKGTVHVDPKGFAGMEPEDVEIVRVGLYSARGRK